MLDFGDNVEVKYRIRRETVFLLMAGLFLGSLTMLNILGVSKIIEFEVYGIPVGLTMGVLPYPITFLCTDFISELFGRRRANLVVWTGLMLNFWVLFILWAGGVLPPKVGSLVEVIAFTCAIPETIAAPAAAAPKTGPIIGIPASDL